MTSDTNDFFTLLSEGHTPSGVSGISALAGANEEELVASQYETDNDLAVGTINRLVQETGLTVTQIIFAMENDPSLITNVIEERLFPRETSQGAGAGNALGFAQLAESQRQNAFNRARDRMALMQATDQLADARRESAIDAMIAAAPFMIDPGMEFFPGEEPGGLGAQLDQRLGGAGAVQPGRIPQVEVPLNQLVNAPMSAGPEQIDAALLGLLNG